MTLQEKIEAKKNGSVLEKEEVKLFEVPIEHTVPLEHIVQKDEVIHDDLEDIIDDEIEKLNIEEIEEEPKLLIYEEHKDDIPNFDEIEQMLKDSEKDISNQNKDCEFVELLKEKHIESLDGINKVLLTANALITEKASLSRNVMSLTKDLLGVMEKNHKLESRQNLQSLKWMGLGIVVGSLIVYLFPEYLPYIKNVANYLNKG